MLSWAIWFMAVLLLRLYAQRFVARIGDLLIDPLLAFAPEAGVEKCVGGGK